MTNNDVLIEKTNSVQNCLKRIHATINGDLERLYILDVLDIVVLNLQRAIQLTIDMAAHIVATERLGIPQSLKDVFQILEHNQILSSIVSAKMQKMVGFRNIAIQDYQAVDPKILKSIISLHLKDFEQFYTEILKRKT